MDSQYCRALHLSISPSLSIWRYVSPSKTILVTTRVLSEAILKALTVVVFFGRGRHSLEFLPDYLNGGYCLDVSWEATYQPRSSWGLGLMSLLYRHSFRVIGLFPALSNGDKEEYRMWDLSRPGAINNEDSMDGEARKRRRIFMSETTSKLLERV